MSNPILVVDDNAFDREVLKTILEKLGYAVRMAADGSEAIDVLKSGSETFQAAFFDLDMPGIDGISAIGNIRTYCPNLPLVVVSGVADEEDAKVVLKLGAVACLKKPAQSEDIARILQQACAA